MWTRGGEGVDAGADVDVDADECEYDNDCTPFVENSLCMTMTTWGLDARYEKYQVRNIILSKLAREGKGVDATTHEFNGSTAEIPPLGCYCNVWYGWTGPDCDKFGNATIAIIVVTLIVSIWFTVVGVLSAVDLVRLRRFHQSTCFPANATSTTLLFSCIGLLTRAAWSLTEMGRAIARESIYYADDDKMSHVVGMLPNTIFLVASTMSLSLALSNIAFMWIEIASGSNKNSNLRSTKKLVILFEICILVVAIVVVTLLPTGFIALVGMFILFVLEIVFTVGARSLSHAAKNDRSSKRSNYIPSFGSYQNLHEAAAGTQEQQGPEGEQEQQQQQQQQDEEGQEHEGGGAGAGPGANFTRKNRRRRSSLFSRLRREYLMPAHQRQSEQQSERQSEQQNQKAEKLNRKRDQRAKRGEKEIPELVDDSEGNRKLQEQQPQQQVVDAERNTGLAGPEADSTTNEASGYTPTNENLDADSNQNGLQSKGHSGTRRETNESKEHKNNLRESGNFSEKFSVDETQENVSSTNWTVATHARTTRPSSASQLSYDTGSHSDVNVHKGTQDSQDGQRDSSQGKFEAKAFAHGDPERHFSQLSFQPRSTPSPPSSSEALPSSSEAPPFTRQESDVTRFSDLNSADSNLGIGDRQSSSRTASTSGKFRSSNLNNYYSSFLEETIAEQPSDNEHHESGEDRDAGEEEDEDNDDDDEDEVEDNYTCEVFPVSSTVDSRESEHEDDGITKHVKNSHVMESADEFQRRANRNTATCSIATATGNVATWDCDGGGIEDLQDDDGSKGGKGEEARKHGCRGRARVGIEHTANHSSYQTLTKGCKSSRVDENREGEAEDGDDDGGGEEEEEEIKEQECGEEEEEEEVEYDDEDEMRIKDRSSLVKNSGQLGKGMENEYHNDPQFQQGTRDIFEERDNSGNNLELQVHLGHDAGKQQQQQQQQQQNQNQTSSPSNHPPLSPAHSFGYSQISSSEDDMYCKGAKRDGSDKRSGDNMHLPPSDHDDVSGSDMPMRPPLLRVQSDWDGEGVNSASLEVLSPTEIMHGEYKGKLLGRAVGDIEQLANVLRVLMFVMMLCLISRTVGEEELGREYTRPGGGIRLAQISQYLHEYVLAALMTALYKYLHTAVESNVMRKSQRRFSTAAEEGMIRQNSKLYAENYGHHGMGVHDKIQDHDNDERLGYNTLTLGANTPDPGPTAENSQVRGIRINLGGFSREGTAEGGADIGTVTGAGADADADADNSKNGNALELA